MKRTLYLLFILILLLIPCLAQEKTPCPNIKIIAPQSVTMPGETMSFSVSLSEEAKNLHLEYEWKVSNGTIIEGMKRPNVFISVIGLDNVNITATVEVKGLGENCVNIFSETGVVGNSIGTDHNCEDYETASANDEKARLDNIVFALMNNPNHIAVFHIESRKINSRLQRVFNHLKKRGYPRNRFLFVFKKSETELARLCLWKKGTEIIGCDDCQIVKGEDFSPKKISHKNAP